MMSAVPRARHAPDSVLEFIAEQQIAGVDIGNDTKFICRFARLPASHRTRKPRRSAR